jgi:hypothetical protein
MDLEYGMLHDMSEFGALGFKTRENMFLDNIW